MQPSTPNMLHGVLPPSPCQQAAWCAAENPPYNCMVWCCPFKTLVPALIQPGILCTAYSPE
eukprot:99033-Chlamydomonas_euryale.AAC.1